LNRKGKQSYQVIPLSQAVDLIYEHITELSKSNQELRQYVLVSDQERFRLEDALWRLSEKEREWYLLAQGEGISLSEIAAMMDLFKGTIQGNLDRARKKITDDIETCLILIVN
jgi:RNA polymerase sigma factor (sigma-70 family)